MISNNLKIILSVIILVLIQVSCINRNERLNRALKEAGDNSGEIIKILEHFKDDSIKLEAAQFLIENMINKFSLDHTILYEGAIYNPNEFIELFGDSVKSLWPHLFFANNDVVYDLTAIRSEAIIYNINLAFEVRKRYWWCANLSEKEFVETILPYRVSNEPIDNWREFYFEKYRNMADSVAKLETSLDSVVKFFNEVMKKEYVHEAAKLGRSMHTTEINALGGGTCMHMAVDAAHAMRAIGLPVNVDILPYHGRINGGHAYNSYTRENGETVFFSPYERAKERNSWTAPLVLRSVFVNEGDQYEPGFIDVTAKYYPVFYEYIFKEYKDKDFCLAIFNRGRFHPLKRTAKMIKEGGVTIVPNIMYYPVHVNGESMFFIAQPFYYTEDGKKHEIRSKKSHKKEIRPLLTDGTNVLSANQGQKYALKIWTLNGWQKIGETVAKDSSLVFEDVEDDGLFLVEGKSGIEKMQRPFILENDKRIAF